MLNTLLATSGQSREIEGDTFPVPDEEDARPFPEDYAMRGLLWADKYFPENWFTNERIDEEEKYHELASMTAPRKQRILWLARIIAEADFGLVYNSSKPEFFAREEEPSPTSRVETFDSIYSSTTTQTNRSATWGTRKDTDDQSDLEDDDPPDHVPLKSTDG